MKRGYLSFVRVGVLRVDAFVRLDVIEGVVHEAAVAALVAVLLAAVDQVLFGQLDHAAVLAIVLAFQGADGAEGPAGAAVALE